MRAKWGKLQLHQLRRPTGHWAIYGIRGQSTGAMFYRVPGLSEDFAGDLGSSLVYDRGIGWVDC